MTKTLEIYFKDLNEETQKMVLDFYDLENEFNGNFDISPLFVLENSTE